MSDKLKRFPIYVISIALGILAWLFILGEVAYHTWPPPGRYYGMPEVIIFAIPCAMIGLVICLFQPRSWIAIGLNALALVACAAVFLVQ